MLLLLTQQYLVDVNDESRELVKLHESVEELKADILAFTHLIERNVAWGLNLPYETIATSSPTVLWCRACTGPETTDKGH